MVFNSNSNSNSNSKHLSADLSILFIREVGELVLLHVCFAIGIELIRFTESPKTNVGYMLVEGAIFTVRLPLKLEM